MSTLVAPSGNTDSNPFSAVFTKAFKNTFTKAINAIIESSGCAVPCRLIYESNKINECTNCLNGIYRPGGDVFFPSGKICPICLGKRVIKTQETEDIDLFVIFNGQQWRKTAKDTDINLAGGSAQTMCRIEQFSKLMAAKSIILDTTNEQFCRNEYKREGKPEPCGLGSMQYILTSWSKI